jgi:hypothetical protein
MKLNILAVDGLISIRVFKLFKYDGKILFVHRRIIFVKNHYLEKLGCFTVSEFKSGCSIPGVDASTSKDAKMLALEILKKKRKQFHKAIKMRIKDYGIANEN